MENLHSFVVMAYRDSPYVENCINSLLLQTEKSDICIATSTPSKYIDDIAKKYSFPLHINPHGGSIAIDWNFAYSMCSTKYATLAHQDDIYDKEYTKTVVSKMDKSENALISFTDYRELFEDNLIETNLLLTVKRLLLWPFYMKNTISAKFFRKLALSFGSPICCPSVTFNKELLADFKFDEAFKINLDWDSWLKLCNIKGSFVYVPKRLMTHSIHKESETSAGLSSNKRQNEDLLIFKQLWGSAIGTLLAKFYATSYKSNSR